MTTPTMSTNRGDTLDATLSVTVASTGAAADITGWTPRWTAKRAATWASDPDAEAVLTATVGSGLTVTSNVGGTIALSIAAATMAAIEAGAYVWDLQLTNGTQVRTAMQGTLTVTADVSRTTP